VLFRLFSSIFEMVKHWLHLEVIIRSSLPYPRFGGAFSASGGHVESCAWQISEDLVIFSVRRYSFWLVSSDVVVIISDGCCSNVLVLWGLN
jgi:hypothetical protein